LDDLREAEYSRLDHLRHVYLDYTGAGLYAASQVREHASLIASHVFGNPHSQSPTSAVITELVEQCRHKILDYFRAPDEEYVVIFTAKASAALKLVREAYPFSSDGHYLLTFDKHNSVNGIREFARAKDPESRMFHHVPSTPSPRCESTRIGFRNIWKWRDQTATTCSHTLHSPTSQPCSIL
jgi:molybdenum cofactor sulfurtransferase